MPRRAGFRGAASGALAGLSEGFDEIINDRRMRRRTQHAADYQDELLRRRQEEEDKRLRERTEEGHKTARHDENERLLMKGERTRAQYEAAERGDVEGMEPTISQQTMKILGDPKSPEDVKSIEEINASIDPTRMQPLVRPSKTVGGIKEFQGPYATASLLDKNTAEASGVREAQRNKFISAQKPETVTTYNAEKGFKQDTDRQFNPFEGQFSQVGEPRQTTPSGAQQGQQNANAEEVERPGKVKTSAQSAGAVHEAQRAVDQRRGVGEYAPDKVVPPDQDMRTSFDFANRFAAEHAILTRLEPTMLQRGTALTWQQVNTPTIIREPTTRRYASAAKRAINAQLRRDSGAAITEDEYEQFGGAYTFVPGDDPTSLGDKQAARRTLMQGSYVRMGPVLSQKFVSRPELEILAKQKGVDVKVKISEARAAGLIIVE